MSRLRAAAVTIQRWTRGKRARFLFLRQRRAALVIQREYRAHWTLRNTSAVIVQKWWRMCRAKASYSFQRLQVVKLQRWVRANAIKFKLMALKRSLPVIQQR